MGKKPCSSLKGKFRERNKFTLFIGERLDEKWFVCARRYDPSAGLKREKRFGERLIGKRRALEASKKTYRGWRSGRICVCSKVMILLFAPLYHRARIYGPVYRVVGNTWFADCAQGWPRGADNRMGQTCGGRRRFPRGVGINPPEN